jgi:hypothetical protein
LVTSDPREAAGIVSPAATYDVEQGMKKMMMIVGVLLVALLIGTLVTLRITGLEPQYMGSNRPGTWLKGEVVRTPIKDWTFVNSIVDPSRPKFWKGLEAPSTIMVETQTWYGIPHSVTTAVLVRRGQLYIHSNQGRFDREFPYDKAWTASVARNPNVRIKMGGRIYEVTLVLVPDRDEAAAIIGRPIETKRNGPDGEEHIVSRFHLYHVFQRNVQEYWNAPRPAVANLIR